MESPSSVRMAKSSKAQTTNHPILRILFNV
jgi:hypothetical protein